MIFTFALRRNPCRVVGGMQSRYGHFCGGDCDFPGLPSDPRFLHIATLDLSDPSLAFLQFDGMSVLPLVMDTAEGTIAYLVDIEGGLTLYGRS